MNLKRLFFWLSGAGTEALERCPDWEQRKYVAFGATVLVPSGFAFIASAYAISTLTDKWMVVFPIAAVWAFIILTIDRALLASYRSYLSPFRKLGQFTLRFVVAMLMGLTIAHPLVLLLFRDTVNSVIEKERDADIAAVVTAHEQTRGRLTASADTIKTEIATQQQKWNDSFKAEFLAKEQAENGDMAAGLSDEQQTELKKSVEEATAAFRRSLEAVEKQITELTPAYTKIQTELAFWQAEFERELNGQRSGMVGEGPRAKSIRSDQLDWRRAELKRIGGLLESASAEKTGLETRLNAAMKSATDAFDLKLLAEAEKNKEEEARLTELRRKIQQDQAGQFVEQQNQIRAAIRQQIDSLLGDLKRAQDDLAAASADLTARTTALRAEPRRDILTQTLALHRLFDDKDARANFAWWTYLILTLLFMLVDTIPLVVKFFCAPGPYDTLVDRDEMRFQADHKGFRRAHQRYLEQVNSGKVAFNSRSRDLEHAFTDGVEQTRAAQAFLDSLIEMEQQFHERLEAEKNRPGAAEKPALLEAMKQQFYQSLRERMEQYFADSARHRA
jgi:hypothetical protein